MQGGLMARKVSVCLSLKRVDCDKTEGPIWKINAKVCVFWYILVSL